MISLVGIINHDFLKSAIINDEISLNNFFLNLIKKLSTHLNLDVINKKYKVLCVSEIEEVESEVELLNYGMQIGVIDGIFYIKLNKSYQKFYPFFLLLSAYNTFVPDNLKSSIFINFLLHQFVEIELQGFEYIEEWKLISRQKYIGYIQEISIFRFDKFLDLEVEESSESTLRYFFEYIRRYQNINFDEDPDYHLDKIKQEILQKPIFQISSNDIVESLKIITQIFYKVKNIDTLEDFYDRFDELKEDGLIQTDLSSRKFRNNLRWINKSAYISPSYYFDWKVMDMAIINCYLKFNPLLEKGDISKILNKIPFFLITRLSVSNFAIELYDFLVIPRVYIKDLFYMIEKMERDGYIINKFFSIAKNYKFNLNLNYFLESYNQGQILHPNLKKASKSYELEFNLTYNTKFINPHLNLIDFLILERTRFTSLLGITFSRRKEFINLIRSDYTNYIISENNIIEDLGKIYNTLVTSPIVRTDFQIFLERNQKFGYFYIKDELEKWRSYFKIIEKEPNLNNIIQFKEFVEKENILYLIEESGIFDDIDPNSFGFKTLFLDYLNSNEKFQKEVKRLQFFDFFFDCFSHLKIFSIKTIQKIVNDPSLLKNIIKTKTERLENIKKSNDLNEISYKSINATIDKFLYNKPQIIKPYLINTIIPSMASYFPLIILKNSPRVKMCIKKLIKHFPTSYFYETKDFSKEQEFIFLQLSITYLTNDEKATFISILCNIFKEDVVSFKRYPWSGLLEAFSRKDFYDFTNKEFFYTNDLFDQYYIYIKKLLGDVSTRYTENSLNETKFWPMNKGIKTLIDSVNKRIRSENIQFEMEELQKLTKFNLQLEDHFLSNIRYESIKKGRFFHQYIKSIRLIPAFKKFGLDQYFLYITPFDSAEIDYKLLLTNTFQNIQYNASIEGSKSLLIKYLFPLNDPNTSYLNWLRVQNKIRDYCLFSIEKISQIFDFNNNLSSNGWDIDINNFKMFIQTILFDPNYKFETINLKKLAYNNEKDTDYYGLYSEYFNSLIELFDRQSVDIKKKLAFVNQSYYDKVSSLIKNKIAFPYLNLKNLGFRETIHFLLINIKKETKDTLKNIFQYFNLAIIYDIKGEYYIHGFDDKKAIINGLMVEMYLPDCELAELLRVFEYVFQYLKVEKYLILSELVDGEHFLKSVFGNNRILEKYNPLNNLIWNSKKKIWMNHKLFGKTVKIKIYPELHYDQKEDKMGTIAEE